MTQANSKITRRAALRASTVASACLVGSSLALARRSLARHGQDEGEATKPGDFQEFCSRWLDIAGDYPQRAIDEFASDEYLYRLSSEITKLGVGDIPERHTTGWSRDGLHSGPVWAQGAVFAIEIQLDPGTELKAHNHPAFNAVSMVTRGACKYRHFEPLGEAPDYRTALRESFYLQETRSGILRPGRMTNLSRKRENIHWFQAGEEGVTLIDFSMHFGGSPGDFSVLEFDPEPVDDEERIYEGYWIGNPYR